MQLEKLLPIVAVAALASLPLSAGPLPFKFSLAPAADLSALPGETISWDLLTENDDSSLFLSIDAVNWTAVLDSNQGTADNFNAFLFPLIAPSTTESDALFSITWDPAATLGYSAANTFIISSSFCQDANYDGCTSNSDVELPFVAAMAEPVPEPKPAATLGIALTIAACIARQRRRLRQPARLDGSTIR